MGKSTRIGKLALPLDAAAWIRDGGDDDRLAALLGEALMDEPYEADPERAGWITIEVVRWEGTRAEAALEAPETMLDLEQ